MGIPVFQWTSAHYSSAVDQPKFMGHAPDHPWWKTGSAESFFGYPNYLDLSLKCIFFLINTKFACFLFNRVPTYQELGRSSGDFKGHVGSPNQVRDRNIHRTAIDCVTRVYALYHTIGLHRYDGLKFVSKLFKCSVISQTSQQHCC